MERHEIDVGLPRDKQVIQIRLAIAKEECESAADALEFVNVDDVADKLAREGTLVPPAEGVSWETHMAQRKGIIEGQVKTLREAARILGGFAANIPKIEGGE